MKIIGIMPIKLQNERLTGKNTKLLGGIPLLQHSLINLINTELCDEIYVYCSNKEITNYLPSKVQFLKRPEYLDLPTSNFTQIFSSFMKEKDADIYVFMHATAPFVMVETMKECINAVKNNSYDSSFCATIIQDFLWQDNKPLNFDASNLPRSQDLKPIYRETSGIYVFKKDVFTTLNRRIGNNPYIKVVSFKESIDINNPEDFDLAEALYDTNL